MTQYSYNAYDPWRHHDDAAVVDDEQKRRTKQQNKCIHGYLDRLANDLNAAGLDIRRTLRGEWEIPWSEATAKELIWRRVQLAMYPDKLSTTELTTEEVSEVLAVIQAHMALKGIITPWPTRFNGGGKE